VSALVTEPESDHDASTPAWSRRMAVCHRVWAVTFLAFSDGHWPAAVVTCRARRFSTVSRLSRPPARFGNRAVPVRRAAGEPGAQDGDGDRGERGEEWRAN
jgi:hypothetical protein